jgi:dihydroxyacid dehydratase/phosphogluconate dehydratase
MTRKRARPSCSLGVFVLVLVSAFGAAPVQSVWILDGVGAVWTHLVRTRVTLDATCLAHQLIAIGTLCNGITVVRARRAHVDLAHRADLDLHLARVVARVAHVVLVGELVVEGSVMRAAALAPASQAHHLVAVVTASKVLHTS